MFPIIFPKVYNVNFSIRFWLTFLFSSAILHHVPAMETPMRSFMYLPILRNARMIFITMYKYNNSTAIITETMEKKAAKKGICANTTIVIQGSIVENILNIALQY